MYQKGLTNMDKCDILLSIYDPNLDYLIKQLISLNEQTYSDIELFVFDDCVTKRTERSLFLKYITKYPVTFLPYENKNLGYTKAFEKLTMASTGKYVAFCDQDDIWHPDKIEKSIQTLESDHSLIAVSDRRLIDGNDDVFVESVKKSSHKFYDCWETGDDILMSNIITTHAVGMSMVLNGDFLRSTVPFSNYTGHDKWVLCCAAIEGTISYINEPLVDYRRHGNNVSGVMKDINNKNDYYVKRVENQKNIFKDLELKYKDFKHKSEIEEMFDARMKHNIMKMKKFYNIAPDVFKFEMLLSIIPNSIFKLLKKLAIKFSN